MSKTLHTADQGTALPPHVPANMMSLYMTRYDYDYNREGWEEREGGGELEAEVSGSVRNRPIFAYGSPDGDRDARTIYQVDYTARDGTVKDMQGLAASLSHGAAAAHLSTAVVTTTVGEKGTAYQRQWYRPNLTQSLRKEDGTLPQTAYQEDYTARRAAGGQASTEPLPVYAGAAATMYNADLLKPNGVIENDGAGIPPKITARESLLPKGWVAGMDTTRPPVTRSTGPSSTLGPAAAVSGAYVCTSWDIGDVSQAHPSQLPVSLSHSIAAGGVDVTANPDKAALLRQLAGKKAADANGMAVTSRGVGDGRLRDEHDRTNPQLISAQAQRTCGVSRRLESEHHVEMSIYKSDFVDQAQLPELPGNHAGPADVRDTQTCSAVAAGEMTAGQLSKSARALSAMRNSHGTLTSKSAALDSIRATEKAIAIEKADPHRQKLH